MCGITGFVISDVYCSELNSPTLGPVLKKMLARIARRGPDAEGTYFDSYSEYQLAFGHRRLSIIDIEGGYQPMTRETGRSKNAIVFNGEIFNFQELAAELRSQGVNLKTRSDTEVLLELLSQTDGSKESITKVLRRLNGMFAFAFWHAESEQLILARDRIGIKPLYYAELEHGGIAFASVLTSVLEFPLGFDRSLDPAGLTDFFFHDYIPAPGSIVKGIRKLVEGEFLVWKAKKPLEVSRYWQPREVSLPKEIQDVTRKSSELVTILESAVRRQLISDVRVGVFLSGGIDSSVVTALAQKELKRQGGPALETFSIGFEERSFDESGEARRVASFIGTRHHEEILSESKMLSALDETLECLDEPMGDVSILPTYQVAKLARTRVKVCLGGDGGDELFAGYSFYGAHFWGDLYGKLPRWTQSGLFRPLTASLPVKDSYQSLEWKLKRFSHRFDSSRLKRHLRWLSSTDLADLPALLKETLEPSSFTRFNESDALTLEGLLRIDLGSYLPGSVLTKVDRATMGCGLELRPPFLDNQMVEFALGLESQFKLKGKTSKYILKRAASLEKWVPEDILYRKKKGFSVPISRWIRRELESKMMDHLESSEVFKLGILERNRFREIFRDHLLMRKDWGKTLWSFLVLDFWLRQNRSLLKT